MMKVRRKYVPLSVRVEVAERQCVAHGWIRDPNDRCKPAGAWLKVMLRVLFGDAKVELHHRPALENRRWNARKKDYDPPANDPDHLVYLLKDEEHKIETYVRGVRGQLSDAGLRRKTKKMARNRDPNRRRARIAQRNKPWPKGQKMRNRL